MSVNANRWAIALGAVLLASPAAWAADTVEHSGTVTAVDVARHTITIEEMGPWHPGKEKLEHEVFRMTPETRIELAHRTDVRGDFRGQWADEPLPLSDLRAGDYATLTLTTPREGGRLRATKVEVVRPGGSERQAGPAAAGTKSPS